MTKGRFFLISSGGKVYRSIEFSGDMYPGGHFETAVEHMYHVENAQGFEREVVRFDADHFNLQDYRDAPFTERVGGSLWTDTGRLQVRKLGDIPDSGYYFVRNFSFADVVARDVKQNLVTLKHNSVFTFRDGEAFFGYDCGVRLLDFRRELSPCRVDD